MIWKLIPKFRKRTRGTSWELLKAVIDAIRAEPYRVDMVNWVRDLAKLPSYLVPPVGQQPACGTQGCIAGWMHTMTAPRQALVAANGKGVLGHLDAEDFGYRMLPSELREDAFNLFHGTGENGFSDLKPYPFPSHSDGTVKDQRRYANDVIVNIKKFMKTHNTALQAHRINIKEVYSTHGK